MGGGAGTNGGKLPWKLQTPSSKLQLRAYFRSPTFNLQPLSADRGGLEGFDEDDFSQFLADGEAGIADLADIIGVAGEEPNYLVLAEADFAEAILHFRGSAELFDTDGDAGFDAA